MNQILPSQPIGEIDGQFILLYPPGKTMLRSDGDQQEWIDNDLLAESLLKSFCAGLSITWPVSEGWELRKIMPDGKSVDVLKNS